MKFRKWNRWLVISKLAIPKGGGVKVGCRQSRAVPWLPACIFPDFSEDTLFAPSDGASWNLATIAEGLIKKIRFAMTGCIGIGDVNFQKPISGCADYRIIGGSQPIEGRAKRPLIL
jgi:hypothetical protein